MKYFVDKHSIVREIWGKGDTVLIIFAGASAEFALNKAVDWLYFTGRLPSDPLNRLFSTVDYARRIVFSEFEAAHKAIDTITAIHAGVESKRGGKIPDWAYRDVLFMLIDYSIRSYELMERKLSDTEKEEIFDVFLRMGQRMALKDLPANYPEWLIMREEHLGSNLLKSHFTIDLYRQYKKHLGHLRFRILLETQKLIVPEKVNVLLSLGRFSLLVPLITIYKVFRRIKLDGLLRRLVVPRKYAGEVMKLDEGH